MVDLRMGGIGSENVRKPVSRAHTPSKLEHMEQAIEEVKTCPGWSCICSAPSWPPCSGGADFNHCLFFYPIGTSSPGAFEW